MPDPILRRLTPRRVARSLQRRARARLGAGPDETALLTAQVGALRAEVAGLRQAQADAVARLTEQAATDVDSVRSLTTGLDAKVGAIEEQLGRLQRALDDVYDSVVVRNAAARDRRRAELESPAPPGEPS